jgi:curved DNA-binding protein
MEYKDYYKVLGVDKNASDKEIKTAYRKLARQYHPDVNAGAKGAEERFKEINEAYQVLSDAEKRRKYDQLGSDWQRWQQGGGGAGGFDWSRWTGAPGYDVRYGNAEDLGDMFGGGSFSDFFRQIFGNMGGAYAGQRGGYGDRTYATRPQRGRDYEQEVEITLEEAYHGATRILEKDGRRLEIKIPAGARSGTKVRLAGEGAGSPTGGQAGDLYLRVKVLPHARFERKGADLYADVPVDLYTALLGGKVPVQTLAGTVTLTIKPETQNGQTIRLRGKGMPKLREADACGDLYLKVDVRLPTNLTPRQQELIQDLREAG